MRAVDARARITTLGARPQTSVPVMLETFTFLDQIPSRRVRRAGLSPVSPLEIHDRM